MFSIILDLVLLEVGLRIANLGYGTSPLESDSVFHHVHPKSYNFLSYSPNGEYGGHQVFYDQYGLVADPDGEAAKNTNCRIAFLRDFFTEASQVAYNKSFVGLVESTTNSTVRNYGVSSYSPIFYIVQ